MRVTHNDGLHRNFSEVELHNIFGYVPIEQAMDNQIKAFGSNKSSEKIDVMGRHRHAQAERYFFFPLVYVHSL